MAIPSSWGSVVSDYGKIGISVNVSYPDAKTASVSIEVWFHSKWTAKDSNNNFYFDDGATSAYTHRGSVSINTPSNSAWNESNKVWIYTYPTFLVDRATSKQTRYCAAKLSGVEIAPGTMTHYVSYEIEPLPSYPITYNDNGAPLVGSMPSNQTKWHDRQIHLAQPPQLADGYTAKYWTIGGTVEPQYGFGQAYDTNMSLDLYLNWVENTYIVTYNANGGVSGPDTYGIKSYTKDLEISPTAEPTRTDYNFLGWSTDPNATVATWRTGDHYTANSAVTLYAVWELAYVPPIISDVIVERCDANGNHTDDGTYFDVAFNWATDEASGALGSAVYIRVFLIDGTPVFEKNFDILDLYTSKGYFSLAERGVTALGNGEIDTEYNYTVSIVVMDNSYVTNSVQRTLLSVAYPIDIFAKGKGIAFGKPASKEGKFDVNFDAIFNKELELGDNATFGTTMKRMLLDFFYPVNSIYISYSHKSPKELFGGTWERIENRFLWAIDDTGTIGTEGGAAEVTLTIDQMPTHQHTMENENSSGPTYDWTPASVQTGGANGWTWNVNTAFAGGGQPHNNMPPFVAVAIWRRTA